MYKFYWLLIRLQNPTKCVRDFFLPVKIDVRPVENLSQCLMKKLKEVYCALISIGTHRYFEGMFVIRSF